MTSVRIAALVPTLLALTLSAGCRPRAAEPLPPRLDAAGVVEPRAFVPDSATAVRIAVAVWIPIYGERHIRRQRPYYAVLKGDVWTVTGSLPRDHLGGVALAEISRFDGRILRVEHGR